MSVKSFLFDFGLPGLAAVGVGLATYMLTGGPEEFPEATVQEDLAIEVHIVNCVCSLRNKSLLTQK